MAVGAFGASVNSMRVLLRDLGLLREQNTNARFSQVDVSVLRSKAYRECYDWHFQNLAYDYLLEDSGMLFFGAAGSESFAYMGSPYDCMSYQEYLIETYGQEEDPHDEEVYSDYLEYVSQSSLKEHISYARYDLAPSAYREGAHPEAHIHIGRIPHLRVGLRAALDPMSFLYFTLRQFYPVQWRTFIGNPDWVKAYSSSKPKLVAVQNWNGLDEHEQFLT